MSEALLPGRDPCRGCGATDWKLRVNDRCNVCSPVPRKPWERHPRRRASGSASLSGFHVGCRFGGGALYFGIKLFRDRSRHYANKRHAAYGVAIWWRRSRPGERGYPHTLTFKVVAA